MGELPCHAGRADMQPCTKRPPPEIRRSTLAVAPIRFLRFMRGRDTGPSLAAGGVRRSWPPSHGGPPGVP